MKDRQLPSDIVSRPTRTRATARFAEWLQHIDPGANRRTRGLRLVTAYAIAAMAGMLPAVSHGLAHGSLLSAVAAGFALWASVSEARSTRSESSRDLALLVAAA